MTRAEGRSGWLERRFTQIVDRLLAHRGVHGAAAEAEARAHRLRELGLDHFAAAWQRIAEDLRRRLRRGLDA